MPFNPAGFRRVVSGGEKYSDSGVGKVLLMGALACAGVAATLALGNHSTAETPAHYAPPMSTEQPGLPHQFHDSMLP